MASPTMPVSHPVPLSTLYVSSSARCHCFCALCSRWLTSAPSSGLLALCLARPLPGYSYPSICVSRSPECAHPSCALASCVGGSSWARRCAFWPLASVRSWHFRRDFAVLAAPLGLLVCVWLLFCLPLGASLHRLPPFGTTRSPCLHLARGLPRPLTLPVLPRFLSSFCSWISLSALLLALLVLPRPVFGSLRVR